ncbi:DUF5683 domain-containing protein [Chitinophaga horti]|uniref:DUF5683 domain-containing protein n=1 Tax=Chitinophaga horti TaxID=2920382 RepID=A0ABY6IWB0_9BACT|nr:DUF5683 domain-containing protein [Chitinophaga horti]UYQ91486.1 DUF5683 domain-containing protein [Chitinophaga horti]
MLSCFLLLVLLVMGAVVPLYAQTPDTTSPAVRQYMRDVRAKAVADSLARARQDSLQPKVVVQDTLPARIVVRDTARALVKDSIIIDTKREHDPRKAAFYSAVLPGMGQIYNREYWKLPLVYGALGVSTGVFLWNMDGYREYRDAYRRRMANANNPNFTDKYPNLQPDDLKYIRDSYRQYVDYSVIVFILAYGLNIVDATVFAHLKQFDISDDLSMRLSPKIFDNRALGLSLNFQLGKTGKNKQQKLLFVFSK